MQGLGLGGYGRRTIARRITSPGDSVIRLRTALAAPPSRHLSRLVPRRGPQRDRDASRSTDRDASGGTDHGTGRNADSRIGHDGGGGADLATPAVVPTAAKPDRTGCGNRGESGGRGALRSGAAGWS